MADETAVLLNIGDMIDLAIGSPEIGVVDFNMLQTVLHCLAQQLRVLGKNVELRGSMTTLPTAVAMDKAQTIAVTEFMVETDDAGKKAKSTQPAAPPPQTEPSTILVVERVKKKGSPISVVLAPTAPRPSTVPPKGAPSIVSQAPAIGISSSEKLSLVTLSKFNILESTVEDIKNRVYGSMPKNEEILEEVRSQTNLKAITDMWTSLNVSSRLEAAEAGIAKLSSLVQDLIGESTELQKQLQKGAISLTAPSTMAPPVSAPSTLTAPSKMVAPSSAAVALTGREELEELQIELQKLRGDLEQLTSNFYSAMDTLNTGIERRVTELPSKSAQSTTELSDRLNELGEKIKTCCDTIGKNDGVISDQLNSFQDQLDAMMKQVAAITEDLATGKLSPDLIKDLQGLLQLFQTVQEMQDQLKQVHETALQLAAEKEDRQLHFNTLREQIELLKTIKLDREDMVEAMAEKADLRMLARKVSHDQFDMACDDLSRGLEHAIGKLTMQESLWQQALDDIQREIETKLDKIELSPVKDFFNNKLKQLQENLKQMASLRREAEAAGTKKRLLRDVNCISCDAQAMMQMETPSAIPVSKPLPATLSMKPYLSYELDAIRKSQASNLPQRNMHDWEAIDKQMGQPKQPQKVRSETDKHMCNRYCGGSHTVTTAAQRVARLGHFIKQWGPDVLPLSSGFAAGDDGRMYKVTTNEAVSVGPGGAVDAPCTPKSLPKKSDVKPFQKPIVISAECRCLDGGMN
ncbi:hypothetical protein K1T71_003384 [Dendrolimus kikuchii]|uniref:Uncharacterized protein n=1 Tax=Dendrolimus kikuchii TaxID=765133 RepID=A0ACC1DC30_9NEOP|nr:hypothetical protein K1T71_003384 [Dendrolimus kikuchii]